MKPQKKTSCQYLTLYKPYGMLSQFTVEAPGQSTLADWQPPLPKGLYPVGRLDKDSEGLLLLTDDAHLNERLLHPRFGHRRTYRVQVEGIPDDEALERLRHGVSIKTDKGVYTTLPAEARLLPEAPEVPERIPPVRFRAAIPTCWLDITLTEGKNRQVRKMCAAVGFPVLRLIRIRMEELELGGLLPGEQKSWEREEIWKLLKIQA